ncbi:hypothetical protein ACIGO6_08235 [Streptomyces sp. NPDC053750]|uniref:hypothetical protein n=1 Tax=Streptomyces sp. NPDC053750 TaxID=3365714 RepID=UPI0037D77799
MRRRWAAAAVVLTWALLHVLVPRPAQFPAPAPSMAGPVTAATMDGTASEPCRQDEGPSGREVSARSPRTAGTAGSDEAVTDRARARSRAEGRGGNLHAEGPATGPQAQETARGTPALQTFRC